MKEKDNCLVCSEQECTKEQCKQRLKVEEIVIDKSVEELIKELYG